MYPYFIYTNIKDIYIVVLNNIYIYIYIYIYILYTYIYIYYISISISIYIVYSTTCLCVYVGMCASVSFFSCLYVNI